MLKKIRIFKRLKELEEHKELTDKAFGILVSEINRLKNNNINPKQSTPKDKICETPEEFMKWFISNS